MGGCRVGLVLVVLLWSTVVTLVLGSLICGPEPMTVVAPLGSMVTFTCVVNTTELLLLGMLYQTISWIQDGKTLSGNIDKETTNGSLVISTLQRTVTKDHITGVPVQCQVVVQVSNTEFTALRSNNATLTAYGPPEAPSNLTSTQSSSNALILSWSAPSSPVQLHYTVTVNTSTTITVTNDTNVTITREQVMAAINSTECDLYTFSVTATNPAGSSIPANLTTPVTFVPAPNVAVSVSTNGSTLNIIVVLQSATDFSNVNVLIELTNSCADEMSYTDNLPLVNNSWTFNINDAQNWTNITVVAENQCRNLSVPVNIKHSNECTRTATTTTTTTTPTAHTMTPIQSSTTTTPTAHTMTPIQSSTTTTPTAHTMTATSSLLPSSTDTTTTPLPVWGTVVTALAVPIALACTVTIIVIVGFLICVWRKNRSKTCCYKSYEKNTDVQFSPDTGLQIRGNTSSTVQYSVVGDTTNMEYSVVGPKTVSSQDCPPTSSSTSSVS